MVSVYEIVCSSSKIFSLLFIFSKRSSERGAEMLTFVLIILNIIILPFCFRQAVRDLAKAERPYKTITKAKAKMPDKNVKPPIIKK